MVGGELFPHRAALAFHHGERRLLGSRKTRVHYVDGRLPNTGSALCRAIEGAPMLRAARGRGAHAGTCVGSLGVRVHCVDGGRSGGVMSNRLRKESLVLRSLLAL